MTNFDWYKIINIGEFNQSGLVSREVTIFLEGRGQNTFLVTRGNSIGVVVDGTFLMPNLNDRNPFIFDGKAAYVNSQDDLFIGFEK